LSQSSGYKLMLFVAPTEPTGYSQSSGYKLKLGPAAGGGAR
jgi:hypothetical protein